MPILLLVLLAVAAEVTVLVLVGGAIGVLPTVLLLIAATVLGGWLLRREGTRALGAFRDAVLARRPPHREVANGVLIAAAAVLIVLPGFLSDVVALVLLFPPTRALVVRRWLRHAPVPTASFQVVDGEVVADEPAPRPLIVIPEARPKPDHP